MIVLVLLEVINMLCKKVRGGNVAYKDDIHKAFETHSWNFLLLVLTHFRFHPSFFGCISTILRSVMLSIRIKGSSLGFFPCSRDVRQSDNLSPLFFCPAEEVLSRAIFKLMNGMRILHMVSPKGYITPSHIFYADDKFIFCRADNKSLKNLSIFLQKYGDFCG